MISFRWCAAPHNLAARICWRRLSATAARPSRHPVTLTRSPYGCMIASPSWNNLSATSTFPWKNSAIARGIFASPILEASSNSCAKSWYSLIKVTAWLYSSFIAALNAKSIRKYSIPHLSPTSWKRFIASFNRGSPRSFSFLSTYTPPSPRSAQARSGLSSNSRKSATLSLP